MQPVQEEYDTMAERPETERDRRAEETLWTALGRLYSWRRLVIGVTAVVAIASVVISLLLPNWYRGSARLLVPESSGGPLSAGILSNLPSAAASLLGGVRAGDYTRYLAILTSRSMMEAAVDSFNLVSVYENESSTAPRETTIKQLRGNVDFEIDEEYDFLSIDVLDKDPSRAASMANFFVRRLNAVNMRLSSENAGTYRTYVQERYTDARARMDSILQARQQFQEQYGVFDLPAQTESFFEQLAALRSAGVQAEIQYEALRDQYGPDNPQVEAYREVAAAANRKYQAALEGSERVLPIPQEAAPTVVREYSSLEMESTIQRAILEILGPMYEQARMQEERKLEAVQVVDEAIIPERKAKPKRSIIVIAATLSAFLLSSIFVLSLEWWRSNHADFARRLQESSKR